MKKTSKTMSKVIHNPTIIYSDNVKDNFEAIKTNDKGIIIGRIIDGRFIDCGFISKKNIIRIESGHKKSE